MKGFHKKLILKFVSKIFLAEDSQPIRMCPDTFVRIFIVSKVEYNRQFRMSSYITKNVLSLSH